MWKIRTGLSCDREEVNFRFVSAEIIDLDPNSPAGEKYFYVSASFQTLRRVVKIKEEYPLPPKDLRITPDVRSMWERYSQYVEGKDTLGSMAYFCLTVLEHRWPGKDRAYICKELNIGSKVLSKLGYLSSEVGDMSSARKRRAKEYRSYTQSEIEWLKAVVRVIIERLGEYECKPNKPLRKITMADLPKP